MIESILFIYVLGIIISCFGALLMEDWAFVWLAPLWPIVYLTIAFKLLRSL